MNNNEFKKTFYDIAKANGFSYAYGGCFQQSAESIIVLELQKSNYANNYYLNFKIYIHNMFGINYVYNKDLVKKDIGDIFLRPPMKYNPALDLEENINDEKRILILTSLFNDFIVPLTEKALSINGIRELAKKKQIDLLPAVKKELSKL